MKYSLLLPRTKEKQKILTFCKKAGAGLVYIRGRRRIGKSFFLTQLQKELKNSLYFVGIKDERESKTISRFAKAYDNFTGLKELSKIKPSALDWDEIFHHVVKRGTKLILILDEIQWIAKSQTGFLGTLKKEWESLKSTGKIKLILCGSSNKFFHEQTGGEEKILRGLKTHSDIWIPAFQISTFMKYSKIDWNKDELATLFMMLGGVPYYLEQIDFQSGFMHGINDAIFKSSSIFMEEVDEVLNLEFNQKGLPTVKKILSSLGQDGSDQKNIVLKTKLGESQVSQAIEKLLEYKIIFERFPASKKRPQNNHGVRYYMKDPFLNFYFQVLRSMEAKIRRNEHELLWGNLVNSKDSYFIPNYSGKAFELFIRLALELDHDCELPISKSLKIADNNYEIVSYWDENCQNDLIVEHKQDRISRIIECKWTHDNKQIKQGVDQLLRSGYQAPMGNQKKLFIVTNCKCTKTTLEYARKNGVKIITLSGLFL